jgi:hypothetical protein
MEPCGEILPHFHHLYKTYLRNDLVSASSEAEVEKVRDSDLPLEEAWPIFERAWRRTKYTGYGENARRALEKVFGEKDITLESLRRMQERLPDFTDPEVYYGFYRDAGIAARIAHIDWRLADLVSGAHRLLEGQRLAVGLAGLHAVTSRADVEAMARLAGRSVKSADDYLGVCRHLLEAQMRYDPVCFKDNSAYLRAIDFAAPERAAAARLFDRLMSEADYRVDVAGGETVLSDWLFDEFMNLAREFDLPVQVHTGHLAGNAGDIRGANAALLQPLIDRHGGVRFDLFHGNWPYGGELLFLVKNYPNVAMDLCWVHIIDPVYTVNLLEQAISSVPHGKIHGFGSDVGGGEPDFAWAHCETARDNTAAALARLIDAGYLTFDDAAQIAQDVLFNNPNEFFRLGLSMDKSAG